MIKIRSESIVPFNQVHARVEELTGKRPHIASIYRWMQKGIAGVRLETLLMGATRVTSEEALDRFFQDSTAAKQKRTSSAPDKRIKSLESHAKELGI